MMGVLSSKTADLLVRQGQNVANSIEKNALTTEAQAKAPAITDLYSTAYQKIAAGDFTGFADMQKARSLGIGNPILMKTLDDADQIAGHLANTYMSTQAKKSDMTDFATKQKYIDDRADNRAEASQTRAELFANTSIYKEHDAQWEKETAFGQLQYKKDLDLWQKQQDAANRKAELTGEAPQKIAKPDPYTPPPRPKLEDFVRPIAPAKKKEAGIPGASGGTPLPSQLDPSAVDLPSAGPAASVPSSAAPTAAASSTQAPDALPTGEGDPITSNLLASNPEYAQMKSDVLKLSAEAAQAAKAGKKSTAASIYARVDALVNKMDATEAKAASSNTATGPDAQIEVRKALPVSSSGVPSALSAAKDPRIGMTVDELNTPAKDSAAIIPGIYDSFPAPASPAATNPEIIPGLDEAPRTKAPAHKTGMPIRSSQLEEQATQPVASQIGSKVAAGKPLENIVFGYNNGLGMIVNIHPPGPKLESFDADVTAGKVTEKYKLSHEEEEARDVVSHFSADENFAKWVSYQGRMGHQIAFKKVQDGKGKDGLDYIARTGDSEYQKQTLVNGVPTMTTERFTKDDADKWEKMRGLMANHVITVQHPPLDDDSKGAFRNQAIQDAASGSANFDIGDANRQLKKLGISLIGPDEVDKFKQGVSNQQQSATQKKHDDAEHAQALADLKAKGVISTQAEDDRQMRVKMSVANQRLNQIPAEIEALEKQLEPLTGKPEALTKGVEIQKKINALKREEAGHKNFTEGGNG